MMYRRRANAERSNSSLNMAPPGDAAALRIELLGGFRVSIGPQCVPESAWQRRKAGHLVKLLALTSGHRLHREQLLELLWPDLPPEAATNNLHRTLHLARQVLEPHRMPGTPSTYLPLHGDMLILTAPGSVWVDVEAFEQAYTTARRAHEPALYYAAIDLYTSDLLPQDLYEDWTIRRREELRGMYLSLLLELACLHGSREEYQPAIEVLKRMVTIEPTHEQAHVVLMRLYALSGQRRQALDQYMQLREALRRELDAEPEAESQELYREIQAGRFVARRRRILDREAHEQQRVDAEHAVAVSGLAQEVPTATLPAHNLPSQLTSFIGRDTEIAEITDLLAASRLITLTGTGGCGKTRLALEVAGRMLHHQPAGVWLVELAALSDARLVPQAVAQALGIREEPVRALAETLSEHLRDKHLLLVLDNCEHLVGACAYLVEMLLRACPGLRVLATSRQRLGVAGEVAWLVPSLAVPDFEDLSPPERLTQYDAIRLFVERARSNRPGFTLTSENAPWVARICQRLDGIPLTIEMAAARVKMLPVAQIAARLDDSLSLLTAGRRTALPRHQTLRATLDWSYALLEEPEQIVFRRLAVFAGSWTLEAAEQVCADEIILARDILDLLAQLVDKSLILVEEHGDEVRYRLLEPVRQYASEKLAVADETELLRRQHAEYYLTLAETAEPELTGSQQTMWLERLEAEHDNLRAALAWALEQEQGSVMSRSELGLRLAGALWRFWYMHSHLTEGRRWLRAALAVDADSAVQTRAARAKALKGAGVLTYMQGEHQAAIALYEEALALYRELDDKQGIVALLNNLGMVAHYQGQYERAATCYNEALGRLRELGDKRTMAVTLDNLGSLAKDRGEYERATKLDEESLALFRNVGDRQSCAALLGNLGNLACIRGDYERAAVLCQESLAQFRALGDKLNIAGALQSLGTVESYQGHYGFAAALFEEALALSREVGDNWGIAASLNSLSRLAGQTGDYEKAAVLAKESRTLHQELHYEQGSAAALLNLGRAAWGKGDHEQAARWYQESLTTYQKVEDKAGMAECLERLAVVAMAVGQPERAARLLGAAGGLREAIGVTVPPAERAEQERVVANVRAMLDRKAFLAAWEGGRNAPLSEIITEALAVHVATAATLKESPADRQPVSLTPREQEIARLIAQGLTNRQIAAQLGMSGRTADTHVGRILNKLGIKTRAQVAQWARENLV